MSTTGRSIGMCSSFAVTMRSFGYLYSHHHCLAATLTWMTSGPFGTFASLKIVGTVKIAITARISAGMIVQRDLERGVAVGLLRVLVALAAPGTSAG